MLKSSSPFGNSGTVVITTESIPFSLKITESLKGVFITLASGKVVKILSNKIHL